MASRTTGKGRTGKIPSILVLIIVALLVFTKGFDYFKDDIGNFDSADSNPSVHFIDVGQGSSTLIKSGTKGILIDAGEREYADKVINYIKSVGVNELEYVIASHPHSDHIGAMSEVISKIDTKNIIMPRLSKNSVPTTRTYENLLNTIKNRGIKALAAKQGNTYYVDNVKMEILGPVETVNDLNNMSVICKVTAFTTTFMMLADAETQELSSVYNTNPNLRSAFILMGHHGSRTSIFNSYLNSVDADVAVISCGKNNSYGHPHQEALDYLKKSGTEYYRTDKVGTVVVSCYEKGYKITTEKG